MKCRCDVCGFVCDTTQLLSAANPFDAELQVSGCPRCHRVEQDQPACDAPGCSEPVTCGTPTQDGYRMTCGRHQPGRTQ